MGIRLQKTQKREGKGRCFPAAGPAFVGQERQTSRCQQDSALATDYDMHRRRRKVWAAKGTFSEAEHERARAQQLAVKRHIHTATLLTFPLFPTWLGEDEAWHWLPVNETAVSTVSSAYRPEHARCQAINSVPAYSTIATLAAVTVLMSMVTWQLLSALSKYLSFEVKAKTY